MGCCDSRPQTACGCAAPTEPEHTVREKIQQGYAQIAETGLLTTATAPQGGGCCGASKLSADELARQIGYAPEQIAQLPEGANMGLSCGNPTAIAQLQPGQVVLDLGSGAGIDLFLAAKKVGPTGRVIGVDMTDAMIAKANQNIRKGNYTNVEVRKGIIEELPVDNASVDWVISNCVINLSPEKPRVFREIVRVLKPGGQMLVSDIVATDLPEEIRRSSALYSSCVSGAIGEDEYLAGLRAVGLVDVEVRARLVYDADQLESMASSESESACGCSAGNPKLAALARTLAGKVLSAKIYARKPL